MYFKREHLLCVNLLSEQRATEADSSQLALFVLIQVVNVKKKQIEAVIEVLELHDLHDVDVC